MINIRTRDMRRIFTVKNRFASQKVVPVPCFDFAAAAPLALWLQF
jgi:hypothetical protein